MIPLPYRGRRARPATILLVLAAAASGPSSAAPFSRHRSVEPPAERRNEVGRFTLDAGVWALADGRFANLRLFDDTGAETPFLVRRSVPVRLVTRHVLFPQPAPVVAFRELADNRVEFTIERSPRAPQAVEIRIESGVRNFEKLVTVHGSTDGASWTPLTRDHAIYDYSRYIDVRNDRVPVPAGPYVRYRIEMGNITERKDSPLVQIVRQTRGGDLETETTSFLREPFRIERVLLVEQREETVNDAAATETAEFDASGLAAVTDARKRQTVVTMDAGGRPVTSLTVVTEDVNFSRAVRLEGCGVDAPDTWQALAAGRISRIRAGRVRVDSMSIGLPETRCTRLRLTIENEDNPPVAVGGVRLLETRHEALFFPKAGRRYTLACGGRGLEAPRYDVAAVLAPVPSGSADLWTLGEAPASGPAPAARSRFLPSSRTVLVGVLVLVAAVLAVIVARLARHVDTRRE